MEPSCYVYGTRQQGWFTKSSTFASDIKLAKSYSLTEAIELCKNVKERGGYALIPVRVNDMAALK